MKALKQVLVVLAILAALALGAVPAAAQHAATDLGTLGGNESHALGLNNLGQGVGTHPPHLIMPLEFLTERNRPLIF